MRTPPCTPPAALTQADWPRRPARRGNLPGRQPGRLHSRRAAGLLDFQRHFGNAHGAVLDGRDIGTVIFPDADVKFFVTASLEARASAATRSLTRGETVLLAGSSPTWRPRRGRPQPRRRPADLGAGRRAVRHHRHGRRHRLRPRPRNDPPQSRPAGAQDFQLVNPPQLPHYRSQPNQQQTGSEKMPSPRLSAADQEPAESPVGPGQPQGDRLSRDTTLLLPPAWPTASTGWAGRSAKLGAVRGTRVAVMDWDSNRYLEAYFAVPMQGCTLMMVNIRLSPEQIAYTIDHIRKPRSCSSTRISTRSSRRSTTSCSTCGISSALPMTARQRSLAARSMPGSTRPCSPPPRLSLNSRISTSTPSPPPSTPPAPLACRRARTSPTANWCCTRSP